MRGHRLTLVLLLGVGLLGCGPGDEESTEVNLGGGKEDFVSLEDLPFSINAKRSMVIRVTASSPFKVVVSQETTQPLTLQVDDGSPSEPATNPEVTVPAGEGSALVLRLKNVGSKKATGTLSLLPAAVTPPPVGGGIPGLTDPVVTENEYCSYQDKPPYVKSVRWDHPLIKAAMRKLGPGWRSTFSYGEWKVSYGLENENGATDTDKRNARVRNFIRTLCGELRDYPAMLTAKLNMIAEAQVYAGPGEVTAFDLSKNLFTQITYPAYKRMLNVMGEMHRYRQQKLNQACQAEPSCQSKMGFNYNFGEPGHNCKRVQRSVPPWTHCEMKFMFNKYMVAGAPSISSWESSGSVKPETYETQYQAFKAGCSAEDLGTMYNFRGHKNHQPLWLESNAFVWNSRRARNVVINRGQHDYFLRPFADRYTRSRKLLATYLFYPESDHAAMRQASEYGGGPILYVTDQDTDNDNLQDYRLFDEMGCGDQGLGGNNPDDNCNMVSWEKAASTPNRTGHVTGWKPELFSQPDMGFMKTFTSFADRMARFNQALDRHTNWGPTSYYMIDASRPDAAPNQIRYQGAYSPIVACSYDISASNSFASGDYPTTPAFESGRTKWMNVMRFRTADYYSEQEMEAGKAIDFNKNYFNETSLSNDNYSERALDRFGWVPPGDVYANIYFVYGARGEQPEALVDIPAP
jgi:hypothetical protein